MVAISVVIPIYNVEIYLDRCLNSIINQNFDGNFEIIAVNDCSVDNSLKIVENYQLKYSNIKIVNHEVNKSVYCARKTGIQHSAGNYILFIDPDDWILPNMFDNLYKNATETKADVILFGSQMANGHGHSFGRWKMFGVIKHKQLTTVKDETIQKYFVGACWNKMVKREILEDLVTGNTYLNNTEDLLLSTEIFIKASTILSIPQIYYSYYINENSTTATKTPLEYLNAQIVVYDELIKLKKRYDNHGNYLELINLHFDKWIYVELFKNHFLKSVKRKDFHIFLEHYKRIQTNQKFINSIRKSYWSLGICLFNVNKNLGFINTLRVVKKVIVMKRHLKV